MPPKKKESHAKRMAAQVSREQPWCPPKYRRLGGGAV